MEGGGTTVVIVSTDELDEYEGEPGDAARASRDHLDRLTAEIHAA